MTKLAEARGAVKSELFGFYENFDMDVVPVPEVKTAYQVALARCQHAPTENLRSVAGTVFNELALKYALVYEPRELDCENFPEGMDPWSCFVKEVTHVG